MTNSNGPSTLTLFIYQTSINRTLACHRRLHHGLMIAATVAYKSPKVTLDLYVGHSF